MIGQSASDGNTLLFSPTQFGGTVQSSIAQANRAQEFVRPAQIQRSGGDHGQGDVLDSSKLRKEVICLKNDSDLDLRYEAADHSER